MQHTCPATMHALFKKVVAAALTQEARFLLWRHKPRVVAITGSVGKTTTKDFTAAALSAHAAVRKSPKSYNSELGIPLTVLGLKSAWGSPWGWCANVVRGVAALWARERYPEIVVVEAGVDGPGDMRALVRWLPVDVAVITRFPEVPVHVAFFSSPEEVAKEKALLLDALRPEGTVVVNHDDAKVRALAPRHPTQKKVTYGLAYGADVRGTEVRIRYGAEGVPLGMEFRVTWEGKSAPVFLPGVVGEQSVYAALAALAVALSLGGNMVALIAALQKAPPTPGRMRVLAGIRNSTIIDDSYNASPVALHKALDTLAELPTSGKKVCVLGDMRELGQFAHKAHLEAGQHAAQVCDRLITVGEYARMVAQAAQEAGLDAAHITVCEKSADAPESAVAHIAEGDLILVKGSQAGIRLERVVRALLRNPDEAPQLLVRQEKEWRHRP